MKQILTIGLILFTIHCFGHDEEITYCGSKVLKKFTQKGNCYINIKRIDGIKENILIPDDECDDYKIGDIIVFGSCKQEDYR